MTSAKLDEVEAKLSATDPAKNGLVCMPCTNMHTVWQVEDLTKPKKKRKTNSREKRYVLIGQRLDTTPNATPMSFKSSETAHYAGANERWKYSKPTLTDPGAKTMWVRIDSQVVEWKISKLSQTLPYNCDKEVADCGVPIACSCPDWQINRFWQSSAVHEHGAPVTKDSIRHDSRMQYLAPYGCKHMIACRMKRTQNAMPVESL